MAKRRRQNSDDLVFSEDDPIGLTSAFAPIKPDPQAVEYAEGDESIGLTQAFASIDTGEDEPAWDRAGKWADFDWNAGYGDDEAAEAEMEPEDGGSPAAEAAADEGEPSGLEAPEAAEGAPATGQPDGEAPESGAAAPDVDGGEEPAADAPETGAADIAGEELVSEITDGETPRSGEAGGIAAIEPTADLAAPAVSQSKAVGGSRRGRHAAPEPELSPRMQQSKRTRRILMVVVALLIIAAAALGYFIFRTVSQSQQEAAQQAQEQVEAPKDNITETEADDTVETAVEQCDVPVLTGLFGMKRDDAVAEVGHGAVVTSERKVKDKGSAVKTDVSVSLTDEPADSKTGAPSVYLGLDKSGKVIQVGYSATAAALGFGSLSFADAIANEHVVEKTLARIGVEIEQGAAALPADKGDYTTYAKDGTTVEKERCSFEGDVEVDGMPCTWSAVLSYDYTTQVVTGNLSDTVRVIYVYLTQK